MDEEGAVFALVALAYAAAGAALYASARSRPLRRLLRAAGLAGSRPLAVLFAAVGLTLGGHALAELVSGRPLAVAFALQAVLLAWLARRISDRRFQLGALTYLGLAAGHALLVDAPWTSSPTRTPTRLPAYRASSPPRSRPSRSPASRAAGRIGRTTGAGLRFLDPLLADLTELSRGVRALLVAGALALAGYAGALGVLEAGQWLGDDLVASFEWSHVAISVLLATGGLAAALVAAPPVAHVRHRRRGRRARHGGAEGGRVRPRAPRRRAARASRRCPSASRSRSRRLRWCVARHSTATPSASSRSPWRCRSRSRDPLILTEHASWNGLDGAALALLALAVGHACLAAVSFTRPYGRDHATAQGFVALVLGGVAIHGLLDGMPRTLVLAAVGTGLAALAVAVRERRLLAAALAYEIVAACYAIALEGPPAHLFSVHAHPGAGLPALLAGLGGALALLAAERRTADAVRRLPERVERAVSDLVPVWLWGLGVGAVYAASLAILELAEILLTGSVEADFQRGHTAVSAFWALVGVVLLHAGLVRGRRVLRTRGVRRARHHAREDLRLRPGEPDGGHAVGLVPRRGRACSSSPASSTSASPGSVAKRSRPSAPARPIHPQAQRERSSAPTRPVETGALPRIVSVASLGRWRPSTTCS